MSIQGIVQWSSLLHVTRGKEQTRTLPIIKHSRWILTIRTTTFLSLQTLNLVSHSISDLLKFQFFFSYTWTSHYILFIYSYNGYLVLANDWDKRFQQFHKLSLPFVSMCCSMDAYF